jgi:hypothetical protein
MGPGLRLLAAVGAASIAASSLAAAMPTLAASIRLVSTAPLTVRGTHFAAHERVRVSFRTSAALPVVVVRATAAGAFTAAAPAGVPYDRCSSPLVVSAAGASGDRAVLRLPPRLCPPA